VLVLHPELVCYVPDPAYLNLSETKLIRIADLAQEPRLQSLGVKRSPESWALLTAKVVWPGANPVERLAPILAALARGLDQVRP
jgi:hypothetical protein